MNRYNKIIFFFLFFLLFLSPLFGHMPGDMNYDLQVDIVDALLIARYISGLDVSQFYPKKGDTNSDGLLNIIDALLIAQYYVSIIPVLPYYTPPPVDMTLKGKWGDGLGSRENWSQSVEYNGYLYMSDFNRLKIFQYIPGSGLVLKNEVTASDLNATASVVYCNNAQLFIYESYNGINIYDISDPEHPVKTGTMPMDNGSIWGIRQYLDYFIISLESVLYFWDISDPSSPVLVSAYAHEKRILNFELSGHYIFMRVMDDESIHSSSVLDISDPSHPVEVATMEVFGVQSAKVGEYIYLWSSSGLSIVDFCNPVNPVVANTLDLEFGGSDIAIINNYLYSAGWTVLQLVDISSPAHPVIISEEPMDIYVNDIVEIDGYVIISYWEDGHHIRIMDSRSSTPLASIQTLSETIESVCFDVKDDYAYVSIKEGGVHIITMQDKTTPVSRDALDIMEVMNIRTTDEYLYTTSPESVSELRIYDATQPQVPVHLSSTDITGSGSEDLQVAYPFLYLLNYGSGPVIYNISDPYSVVFVGRTDYSDFPAFYTPPPQLTPENTLTPTPIPTEDPDATPTPSLPPGVTAIPTAFPTAAETSLPTASPEPPGFYWSAHSIDVNGNYIYSAGEHQPQFRIVDVSVPSSPEVVGVIDFEVSDFGSVILEENNIVYMAFNENGGLRIIDVSNPHNPFVISQLPFLYKEYSKIHKQGNICYLVAEHYLLAVDCSDPYHPVLTQKSDFVCTPPDLQLHYPYIYIIGGKTGEAFYIYEMNSP